MDKIRILNLKIPATHGVYEFENPDNKIGYLHEEHKIIKDKYGKKLFSNFITSSI